MKKRIIKTRLRKTLDKSLMFFMMTFLFIGFQAQAQITVNSLSNLMRYLDDDNVNVKLAPGTYWITEEDAKNGLYETETDIVGVLSKSLLLFAGNNSTYDFTGVTINIETKVFQAYGRNYQVYETHTIGNNNVIKNLTLVDVGDSEDYPSGGANSIVMDGQNNRIEGFHCTVKGSSPYGYGDIFGKGRNKVLSLNKHSACMIRGNSNHVKNSTFIHRAYGHGIYFQAANDPIVEGCYVEGEIRTTDDVLAEEGTGSAADGVDFMTVWGYKLRPGHTFSLQEDGIRSYNAGETMINGIEYERGCTRPRIIDCKVVNMRSGVTIGLAQGDKYVENCTALACESGFWIGSDGEIINSSGDSSVGPLYSEDRSSRNSEIELTLLDNHVQKHGDTPTLYLAGNNHNITLKDGTTSFDSEIEVLVGGTRLGHRWLAGSGEEPPFLDANDITLNNQTNYPVTLGRNSDDVDVESCGPVTDNGSGNSITISNGCESVVVTPPTPPTTTDGNLVRITKRNATGYAIDGGIGGSNGQNVTLSVANTADEGQLWVEIDRGNGFYSYEKYGTNYSLDGNGGGATRQSVYIWLTNATNQNQQWQKQAVGDGGYKLIKRNATGFAINGGSSGVEGRDINLWDSASTNQNLQWYITPINEAVDVRLEAEDFDSMSGIQTEASSESGDNVGFINNGDWIRFDDVNLSGITNMDARVATRTAGGTIEVRTGSVTGALIGSIDVSNTGGYQNWITLNTSISNASGTQDVYLVFTGGNGYLFNVNWIEFNTNSRSNKDIDEVISATSEVKLYPNPVVSTATIENAANSTITIYAMDSSVVFSQAISTASEIIDFSGLARGIYFAEVKGESTLEVIKLIKK